VRQRLAACLLLTAIWLPSEPAFSAERITRFHSDIEVRSDGSMQVTEKIRVTAEGDQIRRGIYRDFPTDYRDRLNNRIQVGFAVRNVTRDGVDEPFFTEQHGNGVRLYIGEAKRLLEPGEYEYAIDYETTRQLGYFEDHDELYWNVTGNGWGFPIESASAYIRLPAGIEASAMTIEGYTGPFGASGQDYTARIVRDSEALISASDRLGAKEGLTVVVTWPKGFVAEPTVTDRAEFLLADNRGLVVALSGLAIMLAYLLFVWSRYGRDPEGGPVFPHYDPPPGLSAGACRYVARMAHDQVAFTAAVLNLAVKGYITIHEGRTKALEAATGGSLIEKAIKQSVDQLSPLQKKLLMPLLELAEHAVESAYDKTFVLEKNAATSELEKPGPGERTLLKELFSDGKYLVLTNTNHKVVSAAMDAHEKALKKFYQRAHFLTNGILLIPAVLIAGLTLLQLISSGAITPLAAIILSLALPLILFFAKLMKAPTIQGRKIMDRIDGFKMYLAVAEADDLQRVEGIAGASPKKTPELFERFLPYAIALDLEQPWADQFERVLTEISARSGQSYRPVWYNGNRAVRSFSGFTTGMTSSLTSAISSSSTAPGSSSGSGGGGSSGGGGGGGGGGGW